MIRSDLHPVRPVSDICFIKIKALLIIRAIVQRILQNDMWAQADLSLRSRRTGFCLFCRNSTIILVGNNLKRSKSKLVYPSKTRISLHSHTVRSELTWCSMGSQGPNVFLGLFCFFYIRTAKTVIRLRRCTSSVISVFTRQTYYFVPLAVPCFI